MARPPVSVIVPFVGSERAARDLLDALAGLELRDGDEILVADNTDDAVLARAPRSGVDAFATCVKRQAYTARNEAAARAKSEWLLFTDADCRFPAGLLDLYFADAPGERTGALAGDVRVVAQGGTLAARYAADRRLLSAEHSFAHPFRPFAVTANLLVRRAAFEQVGGFAEGVWSGADADFCWRLQEAGWLLERRPAAAVDHEPRASVAALLRQSARDSAGTPWLERRFPGYRARPRRVRTFARALAGAVTWPLRGRPERGAFMVVEALNVLAEAAGARASNASPAAAPPSGQIALAAVEPRATGLSGHVEAARRPAGAGRVAGEGSVHFAEDDGAARRLVDALVLAVMRPRAAWAERRRLLELAPAARRLRRAGVRTVEPLGGAEDRALAVALARLAGLDVALSPSEPES